LTQNIGKLPQGGEAVLMKAFGRMTIQNISILESREIVIRKGKLCRAISNVAKGFFP
jgi:hypothetical protein